MGETELGYSWDISYDSDLKEDVIFLDVGDTPLHLTRQDLLALLEGLS